MLAKIPLVLKALAAGVLAAVASYGTAVQSPGITVEEWATLVIAGLVAGYAVYKVPNKPAAG